MNPAYFPLPYTDYYPVLQSKIKNKWASPWKDSGNKLLHVKTNVNKWIKPLFFKRRDEVVLNRLRTGHTAITHGYLMEGTPGPPPCPHCPETLLTVAHIILQCPSLAELRQRLLPDEPALKFLMGKDLSFNFYKFVVKSGIYQLV